MTSGNAGIVGRISGIRSRYLEKPGGDVERVLSDLADRAVVDAWAGEPPGGWAALAVGGYGRRTLHPGSDLDILFFSGPPRRDAAWVEHKLGRLRKIPFPADGAAVVASDFAVADPDRAFIYGACLDARFLAGDDAVARDFTDQVVPAFVERNRSRLIRALISARDAQVGVESVGLDLKNGRGGLADNRWIRWMERLGGGALLLRSEAEPLEAAERFLRSVRTALHWIAGEREDVLGPAHAADVARTLGFREANRLLEECRRQCRTIAAIADNVSRGAGGSGGGA